LWLLAQWYEVRVGGGGIYKVRPWRELVWN
jgi:hypothetical protein